MRLPSFTKECGRQNNGPKGVEVLILKTYEYVTLHSKRDLADVGILREGDYPSGPNIITKALKRGDRSSEQNMQRKQKERFENANLLALKVEEC